MTLEARVAAIEELIRTQYHYQQRLQKLDAVRTEMMHELLPLMAVCNEPIEETKDSADARHPPA